MTHAVERMHNVNKEIFFNYQWAETGSGERGGGGILPRKIVSMESFQFDREIPSAFAIRLSILLVQVTKFGLSFVCLRILTLRC